jgi:phosphohistidine phosphatase SixA
MTKIALNTSRRRMMGLSAALALGKIPLAAAQDVPLRDGMILLFRHATAPGTGDPPGFRLEDCATQRNLSAEGRAEAERLGQWFRDRAIQVGKVYSSRWCRCVDTAALGFPGQFEVNDIFNSFFSDRDSEPLQTDAARALLLQWKGPGVLVVITHQVNITALTGIVPQSAEGVVLSIENGALQVAGRLKPV